MATLELQDCAEVQRVVNHTDIFGVNTVDALINEFDLLLGVDWQVVNTTTCNQGRSNWSMLYVSAGIRGSGPRLVL